jgi:hypothetical protein
MTKNTDTRQPILNLSREYVCNCFLKNESYCTFDLPGYINFNDILALANKNLSDKNLTDFYGSTVPKECGDVNYILFHNKDSKYSWRPFQVIHPAIYVSLVQ